ncbi:RNA polymerase sigma-54 factor, partial [Altererythrobacter sp.]|nr:RNA polymerase sigma-54 factor [Altererythrobacter sp.]
MALGPRLDLRQSQSLVMTPQLQQAIKLLALSNLEIETFIGDALDANPLLEAGEASREQTDTPDTADGDAPVAREESAADTLLGEGAGEADAPLDLNTNAMDRDRDTGDGEWGASGAGARSEETTPIEDRSSAKATLSDHLHEQVGAVAYNRREEFLARNLVDRLDDAGYLRGDLRTIGADLGVALAELEDALELVQSLDPTGVGARNLAECLTLQAKEANRFDPCMERLIANLDLVARGEVARLKRMCEVDDEDFADMLAELREYDPKPGLVFGGGEAAAVVPDILLRRDEQGHWKIALNQDTLPRLVVNRSYFVELRDGCSDRESKGWLKEKLADANWLIKALDQRQKTILAVSSEIVKKQAGFFRTGVSG